jgi:hypothetical protein
VSLRVQVAEIEFHPDQEHQKDQADLTQDAEHMPAGWRENLPKQNREEASEQGWPENQAGSDLPAYLRLTQVSKEPPKYPGCRHNKNQLDDND